MDFYICSKRFNCKYKFLYSQQQKQLFNVDSKEGIYLVNLSIELYDKKGMILATPAPEYKKYLIKTTDGYEFCSITNKAKNRAIFKKTENPNVYKYREISLLDVGMKDVFCNATFKGDMLSFVYKVTYDEANKVPQTSMKLGEWELLRFKCKKLK